MFFLEYKKAWQRLQICEAILLSVFIENCNYYFNLSLIWLNSLSISHMYCNMIDEKGISLFKKKLNLNFV